jgi:hypothetical protein
MATAMRRKIYENVERKKIIWDAKERNGIKKEKSLHGGDKTILGKKSN